MTHSRYPLLESIDAPAQLRALPAGQLQPLADELRRYLIETLAECGGHFAANLGTVELTLALHRVFDTPEDRLVWDVGHQTYPHKILTGRRAHLGTIRRHQGLAPFPKRAESPYDTFGVGHSSTSISAALGMALAAQAQGSKRQVVAVIGDGALTAGMAYEALNHAGHLKANLLVILNDNEMSISPNVGGLNNYLARILSSRLYSNVREGGKRMLDPVPPMRELARRAEEHMKGFVGGGTLFEEMGFNYIGPVDGHDLDVLIDTLGNLRQINGPRFLHIVTRKGKGFDPAERDPVAWHGVTRFDAAGGKLPPKQVGAPASYSKVFGDWLCETAEADERVVGITPAMREGSGMVGFEQRFPARYFDVGIAEQHAVTLAAGMAVDGLRPVVAIYSTFLQRAYDQTIHDVAVQDLPVLFALDRAGLVGADGATHHGAFDLSFLRCLPNMTLMVPASAQEARQMLSLGLDRQRPAAVRYPRGTAPDEPQTPAVEFGRGVLEQTAATRPGRPRIALLAFGAMLVVAREVAAQREASVANMRFVKPLDTALIDRLAADHDLLVTLEENALAGGAGSAVLEHLAGAGQPTPVLTLGLPDAFSEHGSREELLAEVGLDAAGVLGAIEQRLTGVDPAAAPAAG